MEDLHAMSSELYSYIDEDGRLTGSRAASVEFHTTVKLLQQTEQETSK